MSGSWALRVGTFPRKYARTMASQNRLFIVVAGLAALSLGGTSGLIYGKLKPGEPPREFDVDEHVVSANAPLTDSPPANQPQPSEETMPDAALSLEDLEEIPDAPKPRPRAPQSLPQAAQVNPTSAEEAPAKKAAVVEEVDDADEAIADDERPSWKMDDGLGKEASTRPEHSEEPSTGESEEVAQPAQNDAPVVNPYALPVGEDAAAP